MINETIIKKRTMKCSVRIIRYLMRSLRPDYSRFCMQGENCDTMIQTVLYAFLHKCSMFCFVFLKESNRVALHDSHFKIMHIYLILGLGAAPLPETCRLAPFPLIKLGLLSLASPCKHKV